MAACCFRLNGRVKNAAIVSGASPIDRPGAFKGMHYQWKTAFELGKQLPPSLLRITMLMHASAVKYNPERALNHLGQALSKYDRKILEKPDVRKGVLLRQVEATRRGVEGLVQEAKVLTAPWDFNLKNIPVSIHLWYWEDDPSIPLQMGEYLDENIPNTVAHFYPGGGHLAIFVYWKDILKELIKK